MCYMRRLNFNQRTCTKFDMPSQLRWITLVLLFSHGSLSAEQIDLCTLAFLRLKNSTAMTAMTAKNDTWRQQALMQLPLKRLLKQR